MPRSGVTYHPLLEWRLAARWGRYTWEEFTALDGDEQAMVVAAYRCERQIEGVVAWAQLKRQQRASRGK